VPQQRVDVHQHVRARLDAAAIPRPARMLLNPPSHGRATGASRDGRRRTSGGRRRHGRRAESRAGPDTGAPVAVATATCLSAPAPGPSAA
jgi:hypothetical protein